MIDSSPPRGGDYLNKGHSEDLANNVHGIELAASQHGQLQWEG